MRSLPPDNLAVDRRLLEDSLVEAAHRLEAADSFFSFSFKKKNDDR